MERSIITMDRQKKTLHHDVNARKCRGGARGLAGLPCMAPEVLEGYFSDQGVPIENCGV